MTLRLGNDALCIVHRGKHLDFLTSCEGGNNYVIVLPHQGAYVGDKPIEPITWGGTLSMDVYALLGDELALYELSIRDGRASYVRYRVNEEFLRGISLSGNGVSDVLSVAESVLRNYIRSSFMIYTAYLKLVASGNIKLPEYREYVRGRVRVYVRDGIVIIRETSGDEVRISLISTIEAVEQFVGVIMSLLRMSRMINDVRLGRIGHSVKTILDIFIPSNLVLGVKNSHI